MITIAEFLRMSPASQQTLLSGLTLDDISDLEGRLDRYWEMQRGKNHHEAMSKYGTPDKEEGND
jgi:hypothetical protein